MISNNNDIYFSHEIYAHTLGVRLLVILLRKLNTITIYRCSILAIPYWLLPIGYPVLAVLYMVCYELLKFEHISSPRIAQDSLLWHLSSSPPPMGTSARNKPFPTKGPRARTIELPYRAHLIPELATN